MKVLLYSSIEGNVLFPHALNTFYLQSAGVRLVSKAETCGGHSTILLLSYILPRNTKTSIIYSSIIQDVYM